LLIRGGQHPLLAARQLVHLLLELDELLLQMRRLRRKGSDSSCRSAVSIAGDAFLQLRAPPLDLPAREVSCRGLTALNSALDLALGLGMVGRPAQVSHPAKLERLLGDDLLELPGLASEILTSSLVAARAVSPTSRRLPASRNSLDQLR